MPDPDQPDREPDPTPEPPDAGPTEPVGPAETTETTETTGDPVEAVEPAEAAEQTETEASTAPSGDDGGAGGRIVAALRRPRRSQVVVGILLAVLGFAAVTQVRVNETEDRYEGLREQDLIDVLTALAGTRQRTEEEITRLEEVRDELRDDTSSREAAIERAQEDLDELGILAGLVPVTGPGVRITLTEDTGPAQIDSLLDAVQELRTSGAEAMQINGTVRIVAESSFEAVEGGFLVDGVLVEAPYVIDVIGDPASLTSAMTFPLGPGKQLEDDGVIVEVDELTSLDIETIRDLDDAQYADPDPDQ